MRNLLISQDLWMLISIGYIDPDDQTSYNALSIDQKTELKENRKVTLNLCLLFKKELKFQFFQRLQNVESPMMLGIPWRRYTRDLQR